jgi:hypothetical protein
MHVTDSTSAATDRTGPREGSSPMPTRRLVLAGLLITLAGCASGNPNPRPSASRAGERSAECLRTGGQWFVDSSGSATCLYAGR